MGLKPPTASRRLASRALALALSGVVILSATAIPTAARAESPVPATGVIRGTLVDVNGQPLVGYTMRVVGPDGVTHESRPTGSDGLYEIRDLPPATYSYEILDQQGAKIPVRIPPIRLDPGMSVSQPIAIVPRSVGRGGRGRAVAWTLGSLGIVGAVLAAAGNNGNSPSMSPQ